MDLGVEGNSALVTGSSSGLGKESAKALAREGANVVINGRDSDQLSRAVEEVRKVSKGEVVGYEADLTNEAEIESLVEQTVDRFGGIDHLVTSTGGPPSGQFLDFDDADWYAAFDLLVMSIVRLARKCAPHLKDESGTIVMITSISVKEALDSLVLSNSVRMGAIGLEKTLSKEFAPTVRTNTVLPSAHETARVVDLIEQGVERGEFESYQDGLEEWSDEVPLGRIGQPEEVGEVVAFLSSERASYLNGVALPVDGGLSSSNL